MTDKLKHLSLFSGIGGFDLALEATGGFETVAFCEFDKKAQDILRLRWPDVPIFDDIRGINAETLSNTHWSGNRTPACGTDRNGEAQGEGREELAQSELGRLGENSAGRFGIDIITAGFPCQPFSVAGARRGKDDNRYLWPELLRVIQLVKPTWCILENVRGLLSIEDGMVFEHCLSDLEASGYEHQTLVIPACAKNAQHRRDRVWILAHAINDADRANRGEEGEKSSIQGEHREAGRSRITSRTGGGGENVADTIADNAQGNLGGVVDEEVRRIQGERQAGSCGNGEGGGSTKPRFCREPYGLSSWLDEQGLPKVSKGVPGRVDRLKQLGNAIVPQIAYEIGKAILETNRAD